MIFLFSAEMYNDERLWRGQTSCCRVEENKRLKGRKEFLEFVAALAISGGRVGMHQP